MTHIFGMGNVFGDEIDGFGSESRPSGHYGGSSRGDASRPNRYSDSGAGSGYGGGHSDYNRRYSDRDEGFDRYGDTRSQRYDDRGHDRDFDRSRDREDRPESTSVVSEEQDVPKPSRKPKARMKKAGTPTKPSIPASVPQQDLISESFFDTPAPAEAPATVPAASGAVAFDAFGLSTGGTPADATAFDAFGTSGFTAAPQATSNAGFSSDPFATPVRDIAYENHSATFCRLIALCLT